MHRLFTIAVALLTAVGAASARLGDTREQLDKRYGPPVNGRYTSQGFNILIVIAGAETRNGKSVAGLVVKEVFISKQKISDAQLRVLLDANLGSNSWKQVDEEWYGNALMPTWRSFDNTRIAHLYDAPDGAASLTVRWEDAPPPPKGF